MSNYSSRVFINGMRKADKKILLEKSEIRLCLTDLLEGVKPAEKSKCFDDAFKKTYEDVFVDYYMKEPKYKDYKVWITGYSHGGALATLAAADIVSKHPNKEIKLVTSGQPMVGFREYAKDLISKKKKHSAQE
ncbi:triacylglycerol lipase [Necator americanus]|uniref:Triacylglycerol lipase n=1 Tax=Necator americanus TaxID=51031 RepID=W2SJ74_NECAM|nr:triacylglycerol lipase [Necator americanus]ETN68772.1 triacylglycerol lipase [Necator americanus]